MAKNQKTDKLNTLKILSILIFRDGLYFFISENDKKISSFFRRDFSSPKTPEELLTEINAVFKYDLEEEKLKEISEIKVIYAHPYFALVPRPYFLEERLSDYLKFNTKIISTDQLTFDRLKNLNANMVYVPFTNINNYLFEKFGTFSYTHAMTEFIDQCLAQTDKTTTEVYVNAYTSHFDLCVVKKEKLILSNTYDYFAPEDFVYYILFVFEQLNLSTDDVNLYLSGEIEKESKLYNLLFTYIRNISFFSTPHHLTIEDEKLKKAEKHQYQFLLNLITNENHLRKA